MKFNNKKICNAGRHQVFWQQTGQQKLDTPQLGTQQLELQSQRVATARDSAAGCTTAGVTAGSLAAAGPAAVLLAETLATALVRADGAATGADHGVRGFWISRRVRFSNGSLLPNPVVYPDEEMSSCPRLFSSCCLSCLKENYQTF